MRLTVTWIIRYLIRPYLVAIYLAVFVVAFNGTLLVLAIVTERSLWLIVLSAMCLGSSITSAAYSITNMTRNWRLYLEWP